MWHAWLSVRWDSAEIKPGCHTMTNSYRNTQEQGKNCHCFPKVSTSMVSKEQSKLKTHPVKNKTKNSVAAPNSSQDYRPAPACSPGVPEPFQVHGKTDSLTDCWRTWGYACTVAASGWVCGSWWDGRKERERERERAELFFFLLPYLWRTYVSWSWRPGWRWWT